MVIAQPAAVLSVLVTANTSQATRGLMRFNTQLGATQGSANKALGAVKTLAKGATVGAAVGIGFAVKKAADFESQLDSLGAVSNATGRQMDRLRKQAMKAGADTKFSALDAAQAQTELAKGGLRVSQIMKGGLRASLALAAAGELELADAAATTVNAMKLFGLRGRDAMKVADMFATAANRTTADVSDFALALRQGGSAAKAAGLSLNETIVILEALAENGIKGSDAGTSMKAMLMQLANPTEKASKLMARLGVAVFDAQGNMKSIPQVAKNLQDSLGGLTRQQRLAAASTLVGTDGMRALLAVYDAGPQKLAKLAAANAEQGTAADVAAKKQDNLKGKLENLQGSVETIAIAFGSKLLPVLTEAASKITDLLNDKTLSASEKLNKLGQMLGDAVADAAPVVAKAAAQVGVVAVRAFFSAFRESPLWLKLVTVGFIVSKLGGFAAFRTVGQQGGAAMAGGIVTGASKGTAATGGIAGRFKGLAGAFRTVGRNVLGVALIAGVADAATRQGISGIGDRFQQAISTGTFGLIPAPRDIDERMRTIIDRIKTWRKQVKFSDPSDPDNSLIRQDDINDFSKRQQQMLKGMVQLRNTANQSFGPGTKLRMSAWLNPGPAVRDLRMLANEFGRMRQGSVLSVRELREVTQNNFRAIAETMGINSKRGREALQTNFRLGLRTIRDFRERGVLNTKEAGQQIARLLRVHSGAGKESLKRNYKEARDFIAATMRNSKGITQEGMSAIRRIFAKELKLYGLSKEAIKFRLEGKEQSGKTIGAPLVGKQRGGYIDMGEATGDSVHAMLEKGEGVINRKAVKALGGPAAINAINSMVPRFQGGGWVGDSPSGLNSAVKSMALWAMRKYGASASDTLRAPGTLTSSGNVSDHTTGAAVDLVSPNMLAMAKGLVQAFQPKLKQLIHTPLGYSINYGQKVAPFAQADHYDHVHIAALGKAVAGAIMRAPKIARQVITGGADSPLQSIAQNAVDKVRAGALKRLRDVAQVNTMQTDIGGPSASGLMAGVSGSNMEMGRQMMLKVWAASQWPSLRELWTRESGWNEAARNPTSGAYGIPQSLPASKMGAAAQGTGPDAARAQIAWGLRYIKDRYGSPSKALSFHDANNWYRKGGMVGYVGDSLGRGVLDFGGLRGKLGKIGLMARALGGQPSRWGVEQLRQMISPRMDAAVFDMGTNDGTAGNLAPSINAVEKMLGKRPLLMPTIVSGATDAARKNQLIRSQADKVIPWAAAAGPYLSDGIHPFKKGGQGVRAGMIASAVKEVMRAAGPGRGKPKPGKRQRGPRKKQHFPGGGAPSVRELNTVLAVLRNSDKEGKRSEALRGLLDHIHSVGLPARMDKKIAGLGVFAEVGAEMVNRASQLTTETDDGEIIPGVVGGKDETGWLNAQLDVLFKLRNQLVQAEEIIAKRRERISELVEAVRKRLEEIADEIRFAAQVRRQVENDLEQARKNPERVVDNLEKRLRVAKLHPKRNRKLIKDLQRQLDFAKAHPRRDSDRIKNLKVLLGNIDRDQEGRVRVRKGLDRIKGALTGKQEKLNTSRGDLLTQLTDVQGVGAPLGLLSALPEVGVLGGQIFDVQMRLRELAAPRSRITDEVADTADTGTDESAELLRQLLREANLPTAVSEAQFKVLRDFPPFMGAFAEGGVALVGERGPELAHLPSGTRVHSAADTQSMLTPTVIINGDIVNTPRGKDPVEVVLGDRRFKAAVQNARFANRTLPGRGGG